MSGLNLFGNPGSAAWEPAADFVFARLVQYAVSETAAGRTAARPTELKILRPAALPPAVRSPKCNTTGAFCAAGSEGPCQKANGAASPTVCNGGFEIATAVCLQAPIVLDALWPRLTARAKGSKVVGVVYEMNSPSNETRAFCARGTSSNLPGRLVAKGPAVMLEATNATWQRLPMPRTSLKAGLFWIGAHFEADTTCFSDTAAQSPYVGPGSADAFASRPFASGPGGLETSWMRGGGSFAIYATTAY